MRWVFRWVFSNDHAMMLNRDNFVFGADRVEFCGCEARTDVFSPDLKKTRAITEFPQPGCVTNLRSFPFLRPIWGVIARDLCDCCALRQLLNPKNVRVSTEYHALNHTLNI